MIELGLQKISRLLAKDPLPWRAIHVAGTNGKGSVCTYLSEMLNVYNRSEWRQLKGTPLIRHGRFMSPHLVDRWDCISLSRDDGFMEVVKPDLFHEIEQKVLARNKSLEINATEFELLTATAFEIFTHSKLDVAVVETGMGGRLDATNILGRPVLDEDGETMNSEIVRASPLVTAITKIGLDHQGFLGDTIEAIAKEKAGIFKPGVPTVWDLSNEDSVQQVLREETYKTARRSLTSFKCSSLYNTNMHGIDALASGCDGHRGMLSNRTVALIAWRTAAEALGSGPDHRFTPLLDLTTPEDLEKSQSSHDISREQSTKAQLNSDLVKAIVGVTIPGRQQQLDLAPILSQDATGIQHVAKNSDPPNQTSALLDGAHNAEAAKSLRTYVDKLQTANDLPISKGRDPSDNPAVWVIAASDTKDIKQILSPLLKPNDRLFAVEFGPVDGMPWVKPLSSKTIVAAARELVPDLRQAKAYGTDLLAALTAAFNEHQYARSSGPVVITGSLYLIGDVHRLLRNSIAALKSP